MLLAGLLGLAIGLVQVFAPQFCDGNVLAAPTVAGRAVGNLRQPNHLATLMLWACACAVWLADHGGLNRRWATLAIAALVLGVVLTASRTGLWIGVPMLFIWALLDRQMSTPMRRSLWATPIVALSGWGLMYWLSLHGQAFESEARLHSSSDISSSRFAIWSNTWDLIRAHPLTGVGFGEFNFAWSLTPFPNRPIAFFDHSHNLVLQFAVELGLPLTLLLLGLLLYAMWRLLMAALGPKGQASAAPSSNTALARMSLYIVVLVMAHSQLEYPLWYAYFLLPTMFFWGLGLAAEQPPASNPLASDQPHKAPTQFTRELAWRRPALIACSMAMVIGSLGAVLDYISVVRVFEVSTRPLDERIARGQRSVLFGFQADYAAATISEDSPPQDLTVFHRPLHNLIDTRLMVAYARALQQSGDADRARYVVARLREFQRLYPHKDPFLAECDAVQPSEMPPFQCDISPTRTRSFLDFRRPN